jgi:hypothetical protein
MVWLKLRSILSPNSFSAQNDMKTQNSFKNAFGNRLNT